MGNQRGVKRDFEALERRRMEAARLLKQGWSEAAVARELGVHRQSVNRWAAALAREGRSGLRQAGRAGRRPSMSEADYEQLMMLLERGPEAAGFPTNLWTCERVAEVIEREFGVRYHPAHVWKILIKLGWSCQRPAKRAIERNEEAIAHWKRVTWPSIKKKPRARPEPSSSSTRAGSRSAHIGSGPGDAAGRHRSSSTASRGKTSRRSRE
jgi:transposase